MSEDQIIYERGQHWAARMPDGTFRVYRTGATHSTRCAIIGYRGEQGLERARAEVDRREDAA